MEYPASPASLTLVAAFVPAAFSAGVLAASFAAWAVVALDSVFVALDFVDILCLISSRGYLLEKNYLKLYSFLACARRASFVLSFIKHNRGMWVR